MTVNKNHTRMVMNVFIGIFFFFILAVAAAAQTGNPVASEGNDKALDFKPYTITAIQSIAIEENGAFAKDGYTYDEAHEMCKIFQMKEKDVRSFFRRAKQISFEEYDDPSFLYESRCYAAGKVIFANGDRGTWRIDFERRASITLADKRKFYFFCSNCRDKVFYPWSIK